MTRWVLPGLDDAMVARMADQSHRPEEVWIDQSTFSSPREMMQPAVRCRQCVQDWPCATREALRTSRGYS